MEEEKRRYLNRKYLNMQRRCWDRPDMYIDFTWSEFLTWASNDFIFDNMYSHWKASGRPNRLTPTVDRINDCLGYELDNIQWLTHSDNVKKYYRFQRKLLTYLRLRDIMKV